MESSVEQNGMELRFVYGKDSKPLGKVTGFKEEDDGSVSISFMPTEEFKIHVDTNIKGE